MTRTQQSVNPIQQSFTSGSPLAEAAIARDLSEYADDEGAAVLSTDDEDDSEISTVRPYASQVGATPHSLAGSYRRPSFVANVTRGCVVPGWVEQERLSKREREHAIEAERELLSDNGVIPADYGSQGGTEGSLSRQISGLFNHRRSSTSRAEGSWRIRQAQNGSAPAGETTALLGASEGVSTGRFAPDERQEIDQKWEEAVIAGLIHTTWRREAKVIGTSAAPLVVTFLLQYSLTVASIFTVGHLGTTQLGAVSLASMTSSITGYAVYQGLATSLDTLCAQAYGSGKKKLVGLQLQRMVWFLMVITIPIGFIWFWADKILAKIVPDIEVANLAGLYLKVILLGAPGYAAFESGKRFVQAQGLFSASTYVLLICAPLNAFMNWLFVWKFNWGFIGAPLAVAITDNLLPLCLFLYVYFVAGRECWNGFTRRAFHNWGLMIRLALPGLLMVEAECLAFEILTLAASYLGTTALAAQSVVTTIATITFYVPFSLAIAGSTRIANMIGATLVDNAKTTAKVSICGAVVAGLLNAVVLWSFRSYIPLLFSSDTEVVNLVATVLPVCAAFQLFDAIAANSNGILRGLGRQEVGGYIQLFAYYVIGVPLSMGAAFGLGWGLVGLWTGVPIGLSLVSIIEIIFIYRTDWNRSVEDAVRRNELA